MRGVIVAVLLCLSLSGCDWLSGFAGNVLESDLQQAQAALREGQWTRAQRFLERYLTSEDDPDLRWSAWNTLLDVTSRNDPAGNWSADYLDTMLVEYEDNPEYSRNILGRTAALHEQRKRLDRAVEALEQYCLIPGLDDNDNAAMHRRIAKLYQRQQRFDDAGEALRACLGLASTEKRQAECLYDMAEMASSQEKVGETTDLTRQILALEGADPVIKARAGFILADTLEVQGKTAEALKLFQSIKSTYPNELVINYRIEALGGQKK